MNSNTLHHQFQNMDLNAPNSQRPSSNSRNANMYRMTPHDFVFLQQIGSGSYSQVYKAKYKKAITKENGASPENKFFAIKICSKKHIIMEQKEKYVNVEKTTLLTLASEMDHPGIVNLYYTFHDEINLYFVLDYIPCGELFNYLYNSLNKSVITNDLIVLKFVSQLIDTLVYLRRHLIVHRDLKPENILLNYKGCLMITDFGVAVSLKNVYGRSVSFVGTADYVSPELLLTNSCSFKADIWAMGCIFYQLKQGTPPFRGSNELETFENIVSGKYAPLKTKNLKFASLVEGMLLTDENERLDLDQIMASPFCEAINWNNKADIWTGIWEGTVPIDSEREYYLKKQRNVQQSQAYQPQQAAGNLAVPAAVTPPKTASPPLRTKGIGYPKKRKPVTTQNIVEWRKQLGLHTPYGQQASVPSLNGNISSISSLNLPVSNVKKMGRDYPNYHLPNHLSSQAAAQIVLKKQLMKNGKESLENGTKYQQQQHNQTYNQRPSSFYQPQNLPQHMKTGTLRQPNNHVDAEKTISESSKDNVVKIEQGILFYKLPYVEKKGSLINLDYHSISPSISATEENCNKFLEFMKKYNGKIITILDGRDCSEISLQLLGNGEIRVVNENDGHVTLVGNLSDKHLFIYEYSPEQPEDSSKEKDAGADKSGWCVIEVERKHLYLFPNLSKEWNSLFKKIKNRNKSSQSSKNRAARRSSRDETMIKNAASAAFAK